MEVPIQVEYPLSKMLGTSSGPKEFPAGILTYRFYQLSIPNPKILNPKWSEM
jgi:hypothetical protein